MFGPNLKYLPCGGEISGKCLENLKDSILGCKEEARHISWKFTFFLKPEKSPRRQVKRHSNIPSRVIRREKRRKRWMNQNGAETFLLNGNSVCLSPHQHSHNSTFMSHDQSHPQDTLGKKREKFTSRTE